MCSSVHAKRHLIAQYGAGLGRPSLPCVFVDAQIMLEQCHPMLMKRMPAQPSQQKTGMTLFVMHTAAGLPLIRQSVTFDKPRP